MTIREERLWKKLISIEKNKLNKMGCKVWFVEKVPIKGARGCYLNNIMHINKNADLWEQYNIEIHEGQHFKCQNEKCFCWPMKTDFWAEYHAFKAGFTELLDLLSITKILIFVNKYINKIYKNKWSAHLKALRKVLRLKRFREAARSNFELRRYNSILKRLDNYIEKLGK